MIINDRGSNAHVLSLEIRERKIEIMAEVGVFHGRNVKSILKTCGDVLKEYWGIDKYNTDWGIVGPVGRGYHKLDEKSWHEVYKSVCRYMPFFPQLRMLKMNSEEAANLFPKRYFPNGYFDFVYIDADHSYDAVKKDIELWLPLVKKGGLIGGHDYERIRWPGVKKAVIERFDEKEVILYKKQGIWLVGV